MIRAAVRAPRRRASSPTSSARATSPTPVSAASGVVRDDVSCVARGDLLQSGRGRTSTARLARLASVPRTTRADSLGRAAPDSWGRTDETRAAGRVIRDRVADDVTELVRRPAAVWSVTSRLAVGICAATSDPTATGLDASFGGDAGAAEGVWAAGGVAGAGAGAGCAAGAGASSVAGGATDPPDGALGADLGGSSDSGSR